LPTQALSNELLQLRHIRFSRLNATDSDSASLTMIYTWALGLGLAMILLPIRKRPRTFAGETAEHRDTTSAIERDHEWWSLNRIDLATAVVTMIPVGG
jgi:hypothetical protein